jgi:hypothetical protein
VEYSPCDAQSQNVFLKKLKQKQTNKQTNKQINNFQILWKPEMQKT